MKLLLESIVISVFILFISFSCTQDRKVKLIDGGIYSLNSGGGDYSIAKILVYEGDTIHIRIYKNRYNKRPSSIDTNELSLGSINDGVGNFGIGHLPIRTVEFISWQPKLILKSEVSKEELEGYEMWKEAKGGVFGK